jgi:hypothetical protein
MLLRTLSLTLASSLALAVPAAYAQAADAPAVVHEVNVTAPQPSQADGANYAEREQQSQKAANFQGGDMVVIGVSGGAILVLLLLLLILV